MTNPIRICLTTDLNYLELTKLCIYGIILASNPEAFLIFYILGNNVDLSDLKKFEQYKNVSIITETIDLDKIISKNNTNRYLTNTMYLRILIPVLDLFKDVDKVLYLDSDVLAKKDLTEYFNTDISNVALGVVKDYGCANVFNSKPVNLFTYTYFYSGQLLMNLPRLREIDFTQKCLDILKKDPQPDQPIINKVVGLDVKYLDPKYCFPWHKTVMMKGNYCDINLWNKTYGTHYKSLKALEDASVIWHFHGDKNIQRKHPLVYQMYFSFENKVKSFFGGGKSTTPT